MTEIAEWHAALSSLLQQAEDEGEDCLLDVIPREELHSLGLWGVGEGESLQVQNCGVVRFGSLRQSSCHQCDSTREDDPLDCSAAYYHAICEWMDVAQCRCLTFLIAI